MISSTPPVPHLAVPFSLASDGSAAVVEQDTVTEIAQCVQVLVSTVVGARICVPGYGIPDPTFAGLDPAALTQAAATWEPRAQVDVTIATPPENTVQVTVNVHPEAS